MAAAREEAVVEIVVSDAGEEINTQVKKYDTSVDFPALAETNPTERPWLEYGIGTPEGLEEDEYVKLYVTSKATDNIVAADSKVSIPITTQNLKTGSISSGVLTASDFDDWNDAGATGIACTANKRQYMGKYKVKAKQLLKLGNYTSKDSLDKNNGRILIALYDDTA